MILTINKSYVPKHSTLSSFIMVTAIILCDVITQPLYRAQFESHMQISRDPRRPSASVFVMAPNIFNVAFVFSFLRHKYVDQFVCFDQNAPDKGPKRIQRSLQELGLCHSFGVQNFEVALPDFLKITVP